ncbi:uncharacterized protein P174DRAFT_453321 [Aspergillus novofumigatus IBT 16806]|uniref:Mitochondrial F1F0 ATP synthase subunit Atp14 n=1 Tax=Aspergillus novofumigatus (strain IBT 16806) TaxID=1392255 RepID=A0A2I1C361_ASPN1|nr:uncharacterized protein P174DRAFT_453321 [Aspergillus novofumigatus IBT 16806]PKX92084.1 hypothetical protein P174DRAFT_453321 [Aspergillus novofumigatus IBT 16806]
MMSQTLRASRSLLARVSRQQVSSVTRRSFLTSAVRQADPVQELYLRQLQAYKPTPIKPGDAEAHAYESQDVEVEGQAAAGETAPVEESWFEEEPEEETAHH